MYVNTLLKHSCILTIKYLASFQSVTGKKSMGTSMVYKQDRLIESVGDNPVALSGFIRRGLKMKI